MASLECIRCRHSTEDGEEVLQSCETIYQKTVKLVHILRNYGEEWDALIMLGSDVTCEEAIEKIMKLTDYRDEVLIDLL